MEAQTPTWHKLLPFIVLVPMALIPNGSLISLGILVLTLALVKSSRGPTLAFWGPHANRDIVLGIGVGVALWALSHFVMDPALERLFGRIDLDNLGAVKGNLSNYLFLLALGLVYGGVFEEVLNRGFVIGWGTHLLGERAAIPLLIVSSIVFGLGHLYQDWSGVISTGISGLIFGALYLFTGRKLVAPMLAHALSNAIGVTALYLGYTA